MDENRQHVMFIPEHCSTNGNEITEGFGKIELIKSIPFVIFGLVIGVLIFAFKHTIIFPVLGLVIGAFAGFIFCKKDRISRESILDELVSIYKFSKSQKYYEFGGNDSEKG